MKFVWEIRDRSYAKQECYSTYSRIIGIILLTTIAISLTGCMSIQDAAREGNIEHIKTLLALGTDVDSRTFGGDQASALHMASATGQVDTVKFLIQEGANVNIVNEASQTPLHYAAWNGHVEVIVILIENGAYVSGSESGLGDKVPLCAAAKGGHIKAAEVLLTHGADINAGGIDKYTPLGTAVSNRQVEMVKYLLSKGADVNARAIYGCTPLYTAVSKRNMELARLLLEHGASTDFKCNGRTALTTSVFNDDAEMTEMLLSFGADVNAKDDHENTPLYISYQRNNVEIGRILLADGADPAIEYRSRKTPESFIERLRE